MDKITAGLLGAVAGLASMASAKAANLPGAPTEALHASSYAELLTPIPNAVARLKADDAARAQAEIQPAADVYFSYGYQTPYQYGAPSHPYYAYTYRQDDYRGWNQEHHHHHHHHQQYRRDWR